MRYILLVSVLFYSLFGFGDFLMPDEAFKPNATLQGEKLKVEIVLADDIYLYKEKLKITLKNQDFVLKNISYPKSIEHDGVEVLTQTVIVNADIFKTTQTDSQEIEVLVEYQGCSEKGLCYEPLERLFNLKVNSLPLESKNISESDMITETFKSGNISLILLTFFGFGLLLSMTPCVFPMIPILSSIIVSQGDGMTARKGFMLSLVYVLAMSVAYTMAGVLAGVFGSNIQASLQNPWVLSIFSAVFVLLAISMFGFFEIGLPSSIQSRLSNTSNKAGDRGGYAGVAVMGFLSALIVGPCVAPPLAGALVYIGQTGDALLGGVALFVMSMGMGLPLLLIGTGAGKFMPRPGGWMTTVSKVFGVIMLAIAIWMLSRILPEVVVMLLWATLLIISSIYLGALEPLEENKRSWNALLKGLGLMVLLAGVSLFIGLISGSTSLLNPLEKFTSGASLVVPTSTNISKSSFIKITSLKELDTLLEKNRGKKVMLDFYADWCTSCKELEHNTFSNPEVKSALASFVLIQADITLNGEDEKALSKKYGVFGPPAILFFDENSNELKSSRVIGYKAPKEFLESLKNI